ncbi:MAG: hypothetical protein AB1847_04970 [bacterium]
MSLTDTVGQEEEIVPSLRGMVLRAVSMVIKAVTAVVKAVTAVVKAVTTVIKQERINPEDSL